MNTAFKKILIFVLVVCAAFISVISVSCNKNKCNTITCLNGGICNDGTCTCQAGYGGPTCATVTSLKLAGNWGVVNTSTVTEPAKFGISINGGSSITNVTISNFHDFFTVPVSARVSGDSLIIPSQTVQGKVVQGLGFISSSSTYGVDNTINVTYTVTDASTFVTLTETETWNG